VSSHVSDAARSPRRPPAVERADRDVHGRGALEHAIACARRSGPGPPLQLEDLRAEPVEEDVAVDDLREELLLALAVAPAGGTARPWQGAASRASAARNRTPCPCSCLLPELARRFPSLRVTQLTASAKLRRVRRSDTRRRKLRAHRRRVHSPVRRCRIAPCAQRRIDSRSRPAGSAATYDVASMRQGDGIAKDTAASRRAVDAAAQAAAARSSCRRPYLSGTIRLKSYVTLHLDNGHAAREPDIADFEAYEPLRSSPVSDHRQPTSARPWFWRERPEHRHHGRASWTATDQARAAEAIHQALPTRGHPRHHGDKLPNTRSASGHDFSTSTADHLNATPTASIRRLRSSHRQHLHRLLRRRDLPEGQPSMGWRPAQRRAPDV